MAQESYEPGAVTRDTVLKTLDELYHHQFVHYYEIKCGSAENKFLIGRIIGIKGHSFIFADVSNEIVPSRIYPYGELIIDVMDVNDGTCEVRRIELKDILIYGLLNRDGWKYILSPIPKEEQIIFEQQYKALKTLKEIRRTDLDG